MQTIQLTDHAIARAWEREKVCERELRDILRRAEDSEDPQVILRKVRGSHHRIVVRAENGEKCLDVILRKGFILTVLPRNRIKGEQYRHFIKFHEHSLKFGLEIDYPGFVKIEEIALLLQTSFSVVGMTIQVEGKQAKIAVIVDARRRLRRMVGLTFESNLVDNICDPEGEFIRWVAK